MSLDSEQTAKCIGTASPHPAHAGEAGCVGVGVGQVWL